MSKEPIIRCKCCKGEAYGYLVPAMILDKCPYCAHNCNPGLHVNEASRRIWDDAPRKTHPTMDYICAICRHKANFAIRHTCEDFAT